MAKQGDARKHAEWRERLDRFDAGGGTVTQFCREEGVTPHRFYYWVKRLRGSKDSRQAAREEADSPESGCDIW